MVTEGRSRFFQLWERAKFSSEQIKEILSINKNTLMKFFTSSMERLENRIERHSNENTLLNKKSKASRQVQIFKTNGLKKQREIQRMRAKDPIEEDIKLVEQKHQQLEEKISELEDRSRRNNLWFSWFTEKAEGAETW